MLETLKAERIPCKLSEMQMGSVVENTWKKLSVKVLPSLTAPRLLDHQTSIWEMVVTVHLLGLEIDISKGTVTDGDTE